MKKGILVLLMVVASALVLGSPVRGADVIKLKAANYLPVTHKMSILTAKFCDEIKKRTDGRVQISYYPGGTLLSPVKMFNGIVTGIADMGVSHISYTRGRFPVTEVFAQPLGFPSGYVASKVSQDFYLKFKPAEWDTVHVLYMNTSGPLIVQTISKPVRTLEDMKGLKLRATGETADIVKALGASPVPLEMPDVYESLRRAVIDGIMVDLSTLKYWRFAEVVKNVTASWRLGTGYTFYFVMNKAKWDSLPPDIQKIFTEVSTETQDAQSRLWNEMDIEGLDAFKKENGQLISLSEAETDRWIKAVAPMIAGYKKEMLSKGFKAPDIDKWIAFIKERIVYWKAEEKQKGVKSPF
jgi:TRAP-type transport system periplasmic protein